MTLSLIDRQLPDNQANDISSAQLTAELRVAVPGIVQSFNATAQTVVVKPAILEDVMIDGVQQNIDIGQIADVPVAVYRAGTFSLTLPIKAGDECLIVFADACIDAWFQSGGQQARIDGRRHAISDAIAIFGLSSTPRALAAYSTTAAQLRSDDGNTVVEVGAGEVTIKAATITVQSTGNVNVSGTHVNVTGSTTVAISGNNTTTIDGKDFLLHTHAGVTTGGGVTGPVV